MDQTLNPFRAPTAVAKAPHAETVAASEVRPPVQWHRELPICLALAAIILVAYWGVWLFEFVYFDDPGYVTDNLNVVRGLPLFSDFHVFKASLYWAFTAFEQSNWHPLTWLSHMLDVQLYGLEAGGHHVTNVIFHVSNTLLLFWLLRTMTGRSWPSAAVAALFAVHPMHVESVVWVAERKDMLSTFLGLLTLLVYVRYSRKAVLASESLIVFAVLSAVTWTFTLLGAYWIHSVLLFESNVPLQDRLNWLTARWFVTGHPEIFPVEYLWIYLLIFAGVVFHAVRTGRYNLLLYCVIFVLYALGLLAKPMLVTLPCVCLLLDFWPLGRFSGLFAAAPIQPALVERPARAPGTPGRQRKAKRNQRLPARKAAAPAEMAVAWTGGTQILLLLLEKVPLLALSAASAVITPYAQAHGGSMATSSDLSIGFRLENSVQSYMRYITRMFWPGKMSVLYLLDPDNVNHRYTALAVITLLTITGLVIWAAFYGRRYLAFGWFWYVGTLVPVIGIVQVGEQTHADRYTYIPYVGLFVMLAWGIADLINLLPQFRAAFRYAAGSAMILALATSVGWTKYQLQHWTDAETQLRWALTITPDNWNMLNNLGVYLWKQAQKQDVLAAKAEAEGDLTSAAAFHAKSVALKDDAIAQWIHGITARPTATDICSNLGYAYSERGDLDKAEMYLRLAVKLKEISPRPHNNLGRVLLRRSQKCEGDAREAEAKGEAAKAKQLRSEAKLKLDAAIAEFDRAVELDPWLLEARLNLGEVYLSPSALHPEKAEGHFLEIRKLDSKQVKDRETINNFSQGYFGLAQSNSRATTRTPPSHV